MNIQMKGATAEVLLYEDIGGYFGITADAFIREIKTLKDVSTINLRINSNGGNVFDGLAIYNYLKSHKARIEVDIDGLAASIASIIAMAGDDIRIADNAWMMIHDPWIVVGGSAQDLRDTADTMDGIRESLLDTYMVRATADRETISDMMAAETWLNASDATKYGLANSTKAGMKVAASVRKDWFKNAPQALINPPPPEHKDVKQIQAQMDHTMRKFGIVPRT